MLQTVIRPSIDRPLMAEPANSMTYPAPPDTPIWPIVPRMMSLAVTPRPRWPSIVTRIVLGVGCDNVWVAKTCSTSLVPMPNASAPKAPCVAV